jgi:hypothetical protein
MAMAAMAREHQALERGRSEERRARGVAGALSSEVDEGSSSTTAATMLHGFDEGEQKSD